MAIQSRTADGEEPFKALEKTSRTLDIDESSLHLLRRNKISQQFFELESVPLSANPYNSLNENMQDNPKFGLIPKIDAEFITNMHHQKNTEPKFTKD